jgi:hypothetical protein
LKYLSNIKISTGKYVPNKLVSEQFSNCPNLKLTTKELLRSVLQHAYPLREVKLLKLTLMMFSLQMKAFASAEVIIAPHGAGLTNLVFSPDNTKVIEVFNQDQCTLVFYEIALVLGFEYRGMAPARNEDGEFVFEQANVTEILFQVKQWIG